jgi:hypothetical protein
VSKFYFLFIFAEMWRTVQNLKESAYMPEVPFSYGFSAEVSTVATQPGN